MNYSTLNWDNPISFRISRDTEDLDLFATINREFDIKFQNDGLVTIVFEGDIQDELEDVCLEDFERLLNGE